MKINIYIKQSLVIFTALTLFLGCNDDFMERAPLDRLVNENFWNSQSDLELYVNGLYQVYIWGHTQDPRRPPFSVRGSHIAYGDVISDNATNMGQNIDVRLTDAYVVPLNDDNNGWSWGNLRQINHFLANYRRAAIPEETKQAYAGEVYFFKAWDYFRRVQIFGDVPWIAADLAVDSPELYAARDPRALVMDSVLMCINRAIAWLPAAGGANPVGRIDQDKAQFLKSRICLYEGTYRKYHTEIGLQSSAAQWLQESVAASDALISSGRYALYDNGRADAYWALFAQRDAAIRTNPEAVLGVEYNFNIGVMNDLLVYYHDNIHLGITGQKSLVDEYLCVDGRPIYIGGGPGSYVDNPLFLGFGKWTELENRDPRLTQTICRPGEYISIFNRSTGVYDAQANGINFPRLQFTGLEQSGYRFIKHWMPDKDLMDRAHGSSQSVIEFRYAEALLNYVEAKYELGNLVQQDVDITINRLRERAGFDFTTYPSSRLLIGNEPVDPRLDAIYADKLDYAVTPLLREIRRERRVEMAQEDLRYWDLMRWKAARLLTVPMRGVRMTAEMQELYSGSHANGLINPTTGILEFATIALLNRDVFVDEDGFIILKARSTNMSNGILPWSDYRYLWPIPTGQLALNNLLTQNPGWE
ncbi:RagB/SusD family nutrient uptake outer membrane protein [Sphingobacterium paludis]|uniref:Putative outer membrane starch-binding protein n=1 Tax=Sphingobacterium paludis TaxID=1476465 RepID=A0A4R7D0A9_9SPHI|nr:RagB/SusD family nutrient uptake outer membrane protein [Sphingobacterium paludis]TDS12176.1 putative outer membrane starch-binding protein [Sphingobacterium paludis]